MEKFMTEVDSSDTATTTSVIYCHHHDVGYDLEILTKSKLTYLININALSVWLSESVTKENL